VAVVRIVLQQVCVVLGSDRSLMAYTSMLSHTFR
jgi:hypothetical protein